MSTSCISCLGNRPQAIIFMITTEIQQPMPEDVGISRFTGVCGLDGHSQAPRDGFMASRERGEADIGFNAED